MHNRCRRVAAGSRSVGRFLLSTPEAPAAAPGLSFGMRERLQRFIHTSRTYAFFAPMDGRLSRMRW
jgi:hypothetical protein